MPATVYAFRGIVEGEATQCGVCGVDFSSPILIERRKDGRSVWCPNGHAQSWTETEAQKLRKQLEQATNRLNWATGERDAAQKKLKQLEKRIKNGVCPCCKRTFTNLHLHMETKHPEYPQAKP